jgi:hypothetical protein
MGYVFPNSMLKIDKDGNTVMSDSLEPGEKMIDGTTYDQIVAGEHADPSPVDTNPTTVLTVDESGVNTALVTSDGHLVTRLLPLELRAAENAAVAAAVAAAQPTANEPVTAQRAEANDSEPIADAQDAPQA